MSDKSYFHNFIEKQKGRELVIQPRMGFSDINQMRRGLLAVKGTPYPTVGTITLDSYTRTRNFKKAERAMDSGDTLNGYPIVYYGFDRNKEMLKNIQCEEYPVQVRHGSALPIEIFDEIIRSEIDATEGGPISYCLPYSRVPLRFSFNAWNQCITKYAELAEKGIRVHVESFGGCMLGQLCPPALLIAITLIEGIQFEKLGITSISLSYAQGTNPQQDIGAIKALKKLASFFFNKISWHIVFYTFMGLYPKTPSGAKKLLQESASVANAAGAHRLIVKTTSEYFQIPSIEDNLNAIKWAFESANKPIFNMITNDVTNYEDLIYAEAEFFVNLILNQNSSLESAVESCFKKGYWDIPFCLHPENRNMCRSYIEKDGSIHWADPGNIPFPHHIKKIVIRRGKRDISSKEFLHMLSYYQILYD